MDSPADRDGPSRSGFDRLTALADALAELLALATPVGPTEMTVTAAVGYVLAHTIHAPTALPASAIALRDGFAVSANDTVGATPYAPSYAFEALQKVAVGAALPATADAILPAPAVLANQLPNEILATVAPGENIRPIGGDFAAGSLIRGAGERLCLSDIALLQQLGISDVSVARVHVAIVAANESDAALQDWLQALIKAQGAETSIIKADAASLAVALPQLKTDFLLLLGDDAAIKALRSSGQLLVHGIAMQPGESTGCGYIKSTDAKIPLVLLPNRFEQAFAAWLLLARPCLDHLLGLREPRPGAVFPMSRKIVSAPGRSDLVLLRRKPAAQESPQDLLWEPLATGDIPWHALAQAEAWLVVAPDSEGMPAGQAVFAEYL